jgi:hypothetical protein
MLPSCRNAVARETPARRAIGSICSAEIPRAVTSASAARISRPRTVPSSYYAEQVLENTIALLGRITTVDDLIAEWAHRKSDRIEPRDQPTPADLLERHSNT